MPTKQIQPQDEAQDPQGLGRRVFDPSTESQTALDAIEDIDEQKAMEDSQEEADFEALLQEEEMMQLPYYHIGDRVKGKIVKLGAENAFVDLGGKTEAYMAKEDLVDEFGNWKVEEGDFIEGLIINTKGGLQIGHKMKAGASSRQAIEEAFENGIPVEGRVSKVIKGGFEVLILGQRAFCPLSQIELKHTENPELHLDQTYAFKILEYGQRGRKFVVSRAALLKEEAKKKAEEVRASLKVGEIFEGIVTRVLEFGAFIDLGGGVEGLVHITELAHAHLNHPSEVVKEGDRVQVKVLSIEPGKKGDRIALSIKQTQDNPWDELESWLEIGEVYTGTVRRLTHFGAFVELKPGIEGLVHISEMSWKKRIKHPEEILEVGDQIKVAVLSIDVENQRISLSLKATEVDPWEDIENRYPVGEIVKGKVENIEAFGVFLRLDDAIVGLIPLSELATQPGRPPQRDFEMGQEVECVVIKVDPIRRRLTLSRKALNGGERKPREKKARQPRKVKGNSYREAGRRFATFADLLKDALEKKK